MGEISRMSWKWKELEEVETEIGIEGETGAEIGDVIGAGVGTGRGIVRTEEGAAVGLKRKETGVEGTEEEEEEMAVHKDCVEYLALRVVTLSYNSSNKIDFAI